MNRIWPFIFRCGKFRSRDMCTRLKLCQGSKKHAALKHVSEELLGGAKERMSASECQARNHRGNESEFGHEERIGNG